MRPSGPDPYAVLGLERDCTHEQIRAAYRILARQHHPDLNPGSPGAAKTTRELNAAYETLGEPARREAHDRAQETRTSAAGGRRRGAAVRDIVNMAALTVHQVLELEDRGVHHA